MAVRKKRSSRGCLSKIVMWSVIVVIILILAAILIPDNLDKSEKYDKPIKDYGFEYVWAYRHKKGQTYYGYSPLWNTIVSVSVRLGRAQSYHVTKTVGDMQNGLYKLNSTTGEKSESYFVYQNDDVWEMIPYEDRIVRYRQPSASEYDLIFHLAQTDFYEIYGEDKTASQNTGT